MAQSNSKGDRGERELVNYLNGNGWGVLRSPASGSATVRELPDVLAGNGRRFFVMETKWESGNKIYYDRDKILGLKFFGHKFGAEPRAVARFDAEYGDPSYGEDWPGYYLFGLDELYITKEGNFRIKKEAALEYGTPVVDL